MGDRRGAVVRDATNLFEEVFRGTVSEAITHFQGKVKGEIVLVVEGASADIEIEEPISVDERLEARLAELMESGLSERDAVKQCTAEFKLPKRIVYGKALAMKTRSEESLS